MDYQRWGEEIARLALVHSNLTSWVIDDFCDSRNKIFTPAYIRKVQAAAKKINPCLGFLPLLYFDEITNRFVDQYRDVIDGVVTYCLDKRPNSPSFTPAQKLFREFRPHRSGAEKSSAPAASAFDFQSINH